MARVENIVPFILKWETGTTGIGLTNEQLFEKAKLKGFANDPDDLGGETMCGVTLDTYTAYCSKKGYPRPRLSSAGRAWVPRVAALWLTKSCTAGLRPMLGQRWGDGVEGSESILKISFTLYIKEV